MNPLAHCLERLHLGDEVQLQQRAEQLLGKFSARVPSKIFDKGPNCKTVVAIHMAYESLNKHDWDRKLAAQLAGCKLGAYDAAVSAVRRQLNLQPTVTMDTLAVTFGSTTMISHVQELWDTFKERYLARVNTAEQTQALTELKLPHWLGATFYVCAKAFGEHIDKARLVNHCGCSQVELNTSIKAIQEKCQDTIQRLKTTSASPARASRKRERKDAQENAVENSESSLSPPVTQKSKSNEPVSGIVSMIPHEKYTESRRYKDYQTWRQETMSKLMKSM